MEAISSGKTWNLRATRCQSEYTWHSAWHRLKIDWQQFASFVRPSSKPAVRSAIIKSSRSSIFLPLATGAGQTFSIPFSRDLRRSKEIRWHEAAVCLKSDSGSRCVSGETAGEIVEMSATAGLPSSSKQPDNYGETRVGWFVFDVVAARGHCCGLFL